MAVVPNPNVKILYTQEVNRLLPGGRTELRNYTAFNVGPDGPFSVELPEAGWTADAMWEAINKKADQILLARTPTK